MALQERLNKFSQQQQKCLSTLSSITVKAGSCKATLHQNKPTAIISSSISARSPASAIKFSDDIERLQLINTMRKSPVGAQIKRVIDLLLETRKALTPEEIKEACYVDVNATKAVFDSLRNNPKVTYDGNCFSYKSKYPVKGKSDLLYLIRKFPDGIAVNDLKDAYPSVMEDLQALKAGGEIWLLWSVDSRESIAFPNDPKVQIMVDDDLKLFFRGIELPRDMVLIVKALQKNRMKPVTYTARRRLMAQVYRKAFKQEPKKKQRGFSKRIQLTNAHLPELLQYLNAAR